MKSSEITGSQIIDDLKKENENLRRQLHEQRLQVIFDLAAIGIAEMDTEDRFLAVNHHVCQILGYSQEELLAKKVTDITAPEDHAKTTDLFSTMHRGEIDTFSFETRFIMRNGLLTWIYVTVSAVREKDGSFLRSIGTIEDISVRKQAEIKLVESEERFSVMFRAMPIGISLISLSNGQIYDVNEAWLDHTGYSSKAEVIGKNSRELGLIPDSKQLEPIIKEFQAHGKVRNAEATFISKEKSSHVVSLNLDMLRIRGEQYVFYTMSDITEIRQSSDRIQELLRISEQRTAVLHAVIESIPDAVYIGNENGITECNSSALEMMGAASLEDLHLGPGDLGAKFNIRRPGSNTHLSESELPFTRALKGETVIEEVLGTNVLTGEDIYIRVADAPIMVNGRIVGAVAINSDITDRKKIENEAIAKELEIKQKNEELTRFIYTISHDLRSPLVTIQAFSSYLKEDIDSGEKESYLKDIGYIQKAADKMGQLLDELLELSRIGRKEKARAEIPLKAVIESALDLVAGRIDKNSIRIKITGPRVILSGHAQRFIQLYQNLIDNAAKFMGDQPKPLIEIGSFEDMDRNNEIILFIRDNGKGIDPRHRHKIFGLFEKLDNNTEGTGIGLAIVRRIIELHGGTIWFDSKGEGKGTTFYFTLKGTRITK